MSMAAPKGRKHLSADALFRLVRNGFARILDDRAEATGISLADALMGSYGDFFSGRAHGGVRHVFPQIAFPARL